ncbi:unnamed protein product [Arabidopsis thaliana]|nr:unnamed protein product [Arabidopsis thaliana]
MQWRLQIKQAKELQSDNSDNLPLPDSETQRIRASLKHAHATLGFAKDTEDARNKYIISIPSKKRIKGIQTLLMQQQEQNELIFCHCNENFKLFFIQI